IWAYVRVVINIEFDHYASEDIVLELEEGNEHSDIHSEMQSASANAMELLRGKIRDDIIRSPSHV
ncbi:hypothetical protein HAX54_023163, partial [Datura stramonium]|nr:hypothetical protein [Datura stramonium]